MKWKDKLLYGSNLIMASLIEGQWYVSLVFQAHFPETWPGWLLHTSVLTTILSGIISVICYILLSL